MNSKTIGSVILIILILVDGYLIWTKSGMFNASARPETAGDFSSEVFGESVGVEDVASKVAPDTNPFTETETNPYRTVKTNPFGN